MGLPFEKIEANGNDFVLLEQAFNTDAVSLICDRHHGIGADGILVFHPEAGGLRLDHYDPDGSRTFCLNGIRASLTCLFQKNRIPHIGTVKSEGMTLAYEVAAKARVQLPRLMYEPHFWKTQDDGPAINGFRAEVGNPQFVTVDTVSPDSFRRLAPVIRGDLHSFPQGTNVNLLQSDGDHWRVTSYERGVEGFTLACGSGIYACALILAGETGGKSFSFIPDGQGIVNVTVTPDHLFMEGDSRHVASGEWLC